MTIRQITGQALLFAIAVASAATPANAQQIDPRRIASCYLAAENLRERVRPETASYSEYDGQVTYWGARLAAFVPDASGREAMLVEGRSVLSNALAQQGYLAGMTMVSGVLSQCNAGREQLEAASPHG